MSQKKNWIEALERELRQLPEEDRLDIILNYKEQITVMLDEGKSEDEILERLGSPKEVAKEAKQALGYESKFDFIFSRVLKMVPMLRLINLVTPLNDNQMIHPSWKNYFIWHS